MFGRIRTLSGAYPISDSYIFWSNMNQIFLNTPPHSHCPNCRDNHQEVHCFERAFECCMRGLKEREKEREKDSREVARFDHKGG